MLSPLYKKNLSQTQMGGMFMRTPYQYKHQLRQPPLYPSQSSNSPTVLCNGTVLMSNGFHPAQLNYETLQQLRRNIK